MFLELDEVMVMTEVSSSQSNIEFNFDEWMELCEKDPENFEKNRKALIQGLIDQAPEGMQRRLNGLQWTIDTEIQLAKTPMQGCIKVYEMMMDSVYQPGGLQDALTMTEIEVKRSVSRVRKLKNDLKVTEAGE